MELSQEATQLEPYNIRPHRTLDTAPLLPHTLILDHKKNSLPSPWSKNQQNGKATTPKVVFIIKKIEDIHFLYPSKAGR